MKDKILLLFSVH